MKLAVASGKGGTGKTTFCVNLAHALADRGDTVRLKVPTGIVINRSDGKDAIITEYAGRIGIPALIVINKVDLNAEQAERIETIARDMGSRVIARIPLDRNVNDALMAGKTVIEYGKGMAVEAMHRIWH